MPVAEATITAIAVLHSNGNCCPDRRMEGRVDSSPNLTEWQAAIAPHGEHQANSRRLDGQCTHEDGYEHNAEVYVSPELAASSLDDRWQYLHEVCSLRNTLDFRVVFDREQRATQEEQT